MLVIHGIWARGALCLWAEDSALPAAPPAPAGGRASRAARPHPFAADPDVLADALGVLGDGPRDLAGKAAADELSLWLPSAGPGPASSPELIRPAGEDGAARAGPRPPRRAGLLAGPRAGVQPGGRARDPGRRWIRWIPRRARSADPDLAAGGSVVYWAAVARFAADLCHPGPCPARPEPGQRRLDRVLADGADRPGCPAGRGAGRGHAADVPGRRARVASPPGARSWPRGAGRAGRRRPRRARLDAGEPRRCPAGWAPLPPRRGGARPGSRCRSAGRPRWPVRTPRSRWPPRRTRTRRPSWPPAWTPGAPPPRPRPARCAPASGWSSPCSRSRARRAGAGRRRPGHGPAPAAGTAPGTSPPGPPMGLWRVEFALQSSEDPSLMLAAGDVWAGTGGWAPGGISPPGRGTAGRAGRGRAAVR